MANARLLLATHNPGKLTELRALLAELPIELVAPDDIRVDVKVEEDGATFLDNARKKAAAAVERSRIASLADDSGLTVPALNGEPGVRSARFAGPGASAAQLCQALLRALGPLATQSPAAQFRCAAVLMLPGGERFEGEGVLEGTIAAEARGTGGFGYDPIFRLADGRHLAELSLEEKNLLSHRARALAALEVRGAFDAVLGG
jgi:XTP/dITP diphosphohydrolase